MGESFHGPAVHRPRELLLVHGMLYLVVVAEIDQFLLLQAHVSDTLVVLPLFTHNLILLLGF